MLTLLPPLYLMLSASAHPPQETPTPPLKAPDVHKRGHCQEGEQVLFSCPLKTGDTVSLCASADLGTAPGAGRVQFRMGAIGQVEMVYPQQPKSPEFFTYTHETFVRSYGDTVSFSFEERDYTLRYMIGSGHPGEGESNNFQGLSVSGPDTPERSLSCAQPPQARMGRLAK